MLDSEHAARPRETGLEGHAREETRADKLPKPFCPVIFALPSIFWPVTMVVLVTQQIEARCGVPLTFWRDLLSRETHEMREAKDLLSDEESYLGFDEEGGIPMDDLSEAGSRSSDDGLERIPYHMRATRAIRAKFSSRFRSMPYQPISPAVF